MGKNRCLIFCIFGMLIGLAIGIWLGYDLQVLKSPAGASPQITTRTIRDTITLAQPIAVDSIPAARTMQAKLRRARKKTEQDAEQPPIISDAQPDSIVVEIPITQKTFAGDNYRAWVSGYNPNLDSITVYQDTKIITERIPATAKAKRWGVGVTAGYGYTPKGLQPFIGIGLTYNIILF